MISLLKNRKLIILITTFIALFSTSAYADIDSAGILDDVLNAYAAQAAGWAAFMQNSAQWLFWLLVAVSMIFTFGFMALGKADIGEFFAEFIKFIIFVGFFQWLLLNGPNFSQDIINSLRQIAGNASGLGAGLTPSGIVDIGFDIIGRIFDATTVWSPLDSLVGIILGLIILLILAIIGINMLILLISAWFLSFAGVFFLGFGGSKWTSDMAINYYKTVLGLAAELMAMVLLVGIGQNIIIQYQVNMSGEIQLVELCVMLIVAVTLFMLTTKIPPMLSGIISGMSFGSPTGISGGGALAGAAALATAGAALSAGVASAATSIAGGGSAISAAFKEAQATISGGGDSMATTLSGVNAGGQDFNSGGGNDNSDFAVSMGDSTTPSDISSTMSDSVSASSESANTESGSLSGEAESASTESGSLGGENSAGSSPSNSTTDTDSGNTSEESSAESSSDNESKGGFSQTMKKAGAIAGLTLSNLSKGATAAAANSVSEKMDGIKEAISQTAGGKIADEIRNPGQAKQQREDSKVVAAAEASGAMEEISQKAGEIRGTDAKEETSEDEISNFANKSDQ